MMTLQEHLFELKRRVIFCLLCYASILGLCYYFAPQLYSILAAPLLDLPSEVERKLIYTNPSEVFFSYLRLSLSASLFFCSPIFLMQIYLFIAPALYKREKKIILPLFISCPTLFFLGAVFAYYFIIPLALQFFAGLASNNIASVPLELQAKISEYLDFVTSLLFGFGLASQFPIILILLISTGILSVNSLKKRRRYVIVMIFVISAILTPPDVVSQVILAAIMILLFEISVMIGIVIEKKKIKNKIAEEGLE